MIYILSGRGMSGVGDTEMEMGKGDTMFPIAEAAFAGDLGNAQNSGWNSRRHSLSF